jgi:ATP-binding cassette subfamily F protein uup
MADGSKIGASQFMEKFGFNAQQQYTPLSKLSGGEKRRLQLLSVLFRNPNFLVLDEPTNDLDLQTLRTLEEFLLEYPGCILIVSHDRYFMDRMVDHLFAFEGNGVVRDYPGNYTQYREALLNGLIQDEKAAHQIMVDKSQPKAPTKEKVQLSFNEKREFEALEKEIALLGEEKTTLETAMNAGMGYDELQLAAERVQVLVDLLDEKELRWLELSEK